jgi:hypothetical protein
LIIIMTYRNIGSHCRTSVPGGNKILPVEKHKNGAAAHPVRSAAIAILIAAAIFFVLYTPVYSSVTPKIGAWPFFYFYLLVYMPAVSLVMWIVTWLQRRLGRRSAPPEQPGTARAGSGATR